MAKAKKAKFLVEVSMSEPLNKKEIKRACANVKGTLKSTFEVIGWELDDANNIGDSAPWLDDKLGYNFKVTFVTE